MIGQQGQGRERKGRGEDQLSAVGHDSPQVSVFSEKNAATEAWSDVG
jgi:hypothetical protein